MSTRLLGEAAVDVTALWDRFVGREPGSSATALAAAATGGDPPPPGAPPPAAPPDPLASVAAKLGGGLGLVVAVLGFFGAKNGELDRILRNAPGESTFLFGLVLFGVGLSFAIPLVGRELVRLSYPVFFMTLSALGARVAVQRFDSVDGDWELTWVNGAAAVIGAFLLVITFGTCVRKSMALLAVSAWLVGVGTLAATALAVQVRAANDSVRVTAAMGQGTDSGVLSVDVSATRLKTNQSVAIEVLAVPLGAGDASEAVCARVECDLLHQVRLGPGDDGNVTRSVKIAVPPGRYEHLVARGSLCVAPVGADDQEDDTEVAVGGDDPAAATDDESSATTAAPAAPPPKKATDPDEAATRDDCTQREELGGFALVALGRTPSRPSLEAKVDAAGLTTITASAAAVHADAVLCGIVSTAGGGTDARAEQGPGADGAATFTLPVPSQPRPAEIEARAWLSPTGCAEQPPPSSARLRFTASAPTTSTTAAGG